VGLVEGADIEEVTDDMLEKMILSEDKLAVLFYEENDDTSTTVLESLENIDDDLVSQPCVRVSQSRRSISLHNFKNNLACFSSNFSQCFNQFPFFTYIHSSYLHTMPLLWF
jgi:hypothetical protein